VGRGKAQANKENWLGGSVDSKGKCPTGQCDGAGKWVRRTIASQKREEIHPQDIGPKGGVEWSGVRGSGKWRNTEKISYMRYVEKSNIIGTLGGRVGGKV